MFLWSFSDTDTQGTAAEDVRIDNQHRGAVKFYFADILQLWPN